MGYARHWIVVLDIKEGEQTGTCRSANIWGYSPFSFS